MQNLFRRPSGVYVLRIVVPVNLRPAFGKREIIASTGTRELTIAKMVAGAQAAQWRQRFFDSDRLLSLANTSQMHHQDILRISQGHPTLLGGGHLPLIHAASLSGVGATDLLRAAANGRLSLFVRVGFVRGYLLPFDDLNPDNPAMGRNRGVVIPTEDQMPAAATEHIGEGMLKVHTMDLPRVTTSALNGNEDVDFMIFEPPGQPDFVFIPNNTVRVKPETLEVAASEVELLRRSVSQLISPAQKAEANALQKVALEGSKVKAGARAHEHLSTALDAFITNRVRHDVESESEITRIRNGCALLIELEGDLPLAEITSERLRHFRDQKLSRVPANENKIRLIHGTKSVASSMKIVDGTDWPIMSPSERNKRMRWIGTWFKWLHLQKWIAENPAAALLGESVQTKAERRKVKNLKREDESRASFTREDLAAIFGAQWFKAGRGGLTKQGTFRTFSPFYYWLPLLGLYTGGGRINELSQLHLADIRQTESGQWLVDFNEEAKGKKLKNTPSKRIVPVHPALLELGLAEWVAALTKAGYTRLFPELRHDPEKGFGKAATKWFTNYMADLGFARDGTKTFHSFRHTYTNALPLDIPDRMSRQLTGHVRGKDVHDTRYKKDAEPEILAPFVNRLAVTLPEIAPFDIPAGLKAIGDALERKNKGRGAIEDVGGV